MATNFVLKQFLAVIVCGMALVAPSAYAACSAYQGKVVFNEVFDNNAGGFVEVRVLDPGLAASTSNFSGWKIDLYKKTGAGATTVSTANLGTEFTTIANNTCGQQSAWVRIPDASLGGKINGSNPNSNLNFVLYESGKIVDVFRLGAATTLYTPGTSYASCPSIESNIASSNYSEVWGINGNKDWFRTPDGTGTWTGVDTANNNTGCGSNQGGGAFGVSKVASATNVPVNTNFTFTLYAQNGATGATQTGVIITDDLTAAGLTFASCTTASGTCSYSGGVVTWSVGTVAVGTTKSATLTVSAASAGAKTNTITSNIGTPVATASATVQAYAPLADWHLDEAAWSGVANEVKDSSGNGYHGKGARAAGATVVASTASGTPAYTSGSQTTCGYGDFDRASGPTRTYSYVELTGIPPLPSSFTFAAWIRSTNASQSGQRILVRDDAQNGWGFSLGDPGSAKIRFFNRNITNSGAVTGDGSNPNCGVFCLDTAAVITNNAWFFVAVAIDTAGKTVTHYVYNAAGTLVSNTSSAFAGTWADGTGTASIGGETSASSEGTQSSFHFLGNIDELQIYSGVLGQSDLDVLRTRSRNCSGSGVDHYELSVPTSSLVCQASAVAVTACADASSPCTNTASTVSGQTAVLSTSGATLGSGAVTFNGSGVASTTLGYPLAADGTVVSVTLSGEQTSATNARKCCPNGSSCATGNACATTFNTAGFIVSGSVGGAVATIPAQVAGTSSASYYLRAIKTNSTTQACESALSGVQSVNWAYECNNPTTCSSSNRMALNGGTSTTIARNDNASVSTYLPVSMTFDANGNAPFTFNYSDVGQVTLYATKAAGGPLLSPLSGNSNAFVVKPGGFTVTGIQQTATPFVTNPSATNANGNKFIKAGEFFTATVTATTSTGATAPNYGRETSAEGVLLTQALVAPSGGAVGTLSNGAIAGGSFSSGVATVTNLSWSEVGIISLTPGVADVDYLGAGNATGTVVPYVGRFVPDHFDTTIVKGCVAGNFTYSGQPFSAQITPRNLAGAITQNYNTACGFSKAVTLSNAGSVANVNVGWPPPGSATQTMASTQFTNPSSCGGALNPLAGPSGTQGNLTYTPASATGPATFTLRAVDSDGVTSSGASEGTSAVRSGRVRLINAYGSEWLDLPMSLRAEYWNGATWVKNTDDNCTGDTSAVAANAVAVTLTQTLASPTCVWDTGAPGRSGAGCGAAGPVSPMDKQFRKGTAMVNTSATLQKGDFNLWLKAPTASGTVRVDVDVPVWLEFPWVGVGSTDPSARATFGVYKSPLIYRRENY